jgi:serine/threonine protein kinase
MVYDIEDDDNFSYLVEEYLQGNSLENLVSSQGPLTRSTVLEYAIQICGVVNYLHSAGTEPILHLDLQPKNLLICHERIKLVDFGQAAGLAEANKAGQRFGTVGFAAPEQYDCKMELDERTDIYAIGGLLFYLAAGTYPDPKLSLLDFGVKLWGREGGRILAACLEPVKEDRYQSVSQLQKDLECLQKGPVSSLTVTVYGLESGTGVTHISLAIGAYLWKKKIPNLYEESHPCRCIRKLADSQDIETDDFGILSVFGCAIKPYYGRQVRFLEHGYSLIIRDCGVWENEARSLEESSRNDSGEKVCLLVAGGKWWNQRLTEELIQDLPDKAIILYNFSEPRIRLPVPEGIGRKQMIRVPLFSNPFHPDRRAKEWLEFLWDNIEIRAGKQQKKKGGWAAFLARR